MVRVKVQIIKSVEETRVMKYRLVKKQWGDSRKFFSSPVSDYSKMK